MKVARDIDAEKAAIGMTQKDINSDRAKRNLDILETEGRTTHGKIWDEAGRLVDSKQLSIEDIVKKVDNGEQLNNIETAALMRERVKYTAAMTQAVQAAESAPTEDARATAAASIDGIQNMQNVIDEAIFRTGSMFGRGLNLFKLMSNMDYTIAKWSAILRNSNNGKDLSIKDKALLKKLVQEHDELQKQYDDFVARSEKERKASPERAIKDIKESYKKPSDPAKAKTVREAKRKDLLSQLAKITGKDVDGIKSSVEDLPQEAIPIIKELFKTYVEDELDNGAEPTKISHEDIINKVYGDVEKFIGDATVADVRDAISGYGKVANPDKSALGRAIRDQKEKLRLASAMEDVLGGELPKKSGQQRDKPGDQARAMRQELYDAMKKSGIVDKDAEDKYKSALQKVKNGLKNQIADLKRMIDTGERRAKQEGVEWDDEVKSLRLERDTLRKQMKDLDGAKDVTHEQRVRMAEAALERNIADLENRIAANDLERKASNPVASEKITELRARRDALKKEYDRLREESGQTARESLAKYKKELQRKIDSYQARIDAKDVETPKKTAVDRKLDYEGEELLAKLNDKRREFRRLKSKVEQDNKGFFEKAVDKAIGLSRELLLTNIFTLGKIGSSAAQLMFFRPVEGVVAKGVGKIIPVLGRKSAMEAQFNLGIEKEAFRRMWTGLSADYKSIKAGGGSVRESAWGGKEHIEDNATFKPFGLSFGQLHALLKNFPKQVEIERSFIKRKTKAIADGEDINNYQVMARIRLQAIMDGNREIFMGENSIVDAFRQATRTMDGKKAGSGAVVLGKAMDFMFPIVKVPMNFIKRTAEYIPLAGLADGAIVIARDWYKDPKYKGLKPEHADLITRLLTRQMIGTAMYMLGYALPGAFGGYYHKGRKDEDMQASDLFVNSKKHPVSGYFTKLLGHTPLFEVMQFGATVRRLEMEMEENGESNWLGARASTAKHLVGEAPFFGTVADIVNAQDSEKNFNNFAGNFVASRMPFGIGAVAKMTDTDKEGNRVDRHMVDIWDHVKAVVPGVRQTLPVKNEDKNARKKAIEIIRKGGEPDEDLMLKAGVTSEQAQDNLYDEATMPPKLYKFSNAHPKEQIKMWSTLSDKEKEDFSEYLRAPESFSNIETVAPEILRDKKWKKAYEELKHGYLSE